MRAIRGLALGTYYAAGANAARETLNASHMRGLVYGKGTPAPRHQDIPLQLLALHAP